MKNLYKSAFLLLGISAFVAVMAGALSWLTPALAADAPRVSGLAPQVLQAGFIAAALATGLSALGAGIAVASVGSAAIAALAEKPELLGRVLIMVGLAEGIAIYGLIISILILNQLL